ncbi:signal protein PDZ [Rubinisphaera margarita]|uniref:signal protein PDZ n=1 Tax=Rubinisphaera margarita TaxID=2909586 RepID=UPI001EE86F24|nr:signal protein PDZ [Rubinisphaera margarita]MCG6154196.1 signal protein PDZ [Rubinisphaera margarita]
MSRITLTVLALAVVSTTLTADVFAGGCGKSYGHGGHGYRKTSHHTYKHDYDYHHHRKPVYVKPVVIEKPIIREVIIEKKCCPAPMPSLGIFGVICAEGMLVKEVVPNSEACRLGLAPGDVIKTVDDIRIICEDDWFHAFKHCGPTTCLMVIPCGEHKLIELHAHFDSGLKY